MRIADEDGPAARATADDIIAEEAAWVFRARQGDQRAWEQLMRRYQEPVFRLAYLIVGDAAEAEDVAQDAFIRAYLALDQYEAERPLRPWLLSIAGNQARNRRRSLGRYWGALQRFFQTKPDLVEPPPERAAAADAQRLREAVGELRPDAQDIIYLRYFLQLSEAETADALAIPRGTAKSRHHRALAQLRAVIETDYPDLKDIMT
jgi:RNA polymerase sigma-70 factor, ECF subfamily